ncbi:pre-mRNA-splicing factor prp1, putative [Acanthamoeba castellanii str. Neff]|uniref:Pre-mRNA-splicing factor prp1, putative n=1 Tax=Acanthamoeba castellanii (strain ATCC 30010 / Neff) TaxID=1257118 RepID=L8GN18_ACACF|nr:pre-mRNA-splicing factor prp1, putative [Acanthamoeba castellanii str. Neff]ELR14128.1 pre-mRNA-splicing factor prp1, putative [Acanthamoeba castellanii str. Neff]
MSDNRKRYRETGAAPLNYVAGLGRGATGFTTRSDIGPARRCDNDPHVIVAVATVFWQDRKVDKARSWLNRAVVLNPDLGDTWAYFYKFEKQQGTEQSLAELVARCVRTDPRHGRYWTRVRKAPENARLKTDEVLKLVAASLPHP